MPKIHAYINFKTSCAEAMKFYQQCIGGELTLQVVKDSPMKDMFPAEHQDNILHANLESADFALLGSDMPGPDVNFSAGGVTLMLIYDTRAEVETTIAKLSEGGQVTHPLMEFFAGTMGNLVDKFGVKWGVFTSETSNSSNQ